MSNDIPAQLLDNLAKGQEVKRSLKTRSLLNIPEYTFLTNRRIIYYNQKILGRFDLIDIPYSRLAVMKAERGRVSFGSMRFTSEDGRARQDHLTPRHWHISLRLGALTRTH
jgi:hypothetical protein